MQTIKNPFYLYIISFSAILFVYQFGWSELYPSISGPLILFFLLTFFVSLCIGTLADKHKPFVYYKIGEPAYTLKVILGIYIMFALEFLHNKGIPILMMLNDQTYNYKEFGIKLLHPVLVTFTSFYSVYIFHVLISTRDKKNIIYLVLLLLPPVLYFDRGSLLIVLSSFLFVYLFSVKRFSVRMASFILLLTLIVFFLFGVSGNYREKRSTSNDYFLNLSHASEEFKKSIIPKEYMWCYMYLSSPLANLQSNIDANREINSKYKDLTLTEFLPDFASKKIAPLFHAERAELNNISPDFTVGTFYSRPYVLAGWAGMVLIYLFNIIVIISYIFLLKKDNKYYVTGRSILCTYVFCNTFTNMFYFSGLSLQLIFPLLLESTIFKNIYLAKSTTNE